MERRRTLYGRRRGRPLRPNRQRLVETLLPRLAIGPDGLPDDLTDLFGRPVGDIWLEVGFGGGEHLCWQARSHPDVGVIGCEPFLTGVAKLLSELDRPGGALPNIRLFPDDARLLLERLPANSLGRVFVLFPDPWPKTRHHRRRFIAPAQLDALARVMRPGGELRVATDHVGYLRWILFHTLRHPAFRWRVRGPADWRVRPADWPATRYEEKARASGVEPVFLRFERVSETAGEGPENSNKDLVERAENA